MKNILLVVFAFFMGLQLMAQEENKLDDNKVYSFVQMKAEPKEGFQGFYLDFTNEFKIGGIDAEVSEVNLRLRFVVERDGSFTDIMVVGPDPHDIGKEAIRVLKTMPNWKPAQHNGTIVRSVFTLPMKIRVNEEEEKTENIDELEETDTIITASIVETEYFKFDCNQCSVRDTGLATADYRIENKDKTAEFQVTIMQVPEDLGSELVDMLNENVQDPNATFKDIIFLDISVKEVGFYSYGSKKPYTQIISFYKNEHFISISASSSKPELAVKFMNELKQTFKLKL